MRVIVIAELGSVSPGRPSMVIDASQIQSTFVILLLLAVIRFLDCWSLLVTIGCSKC